MKTSIKEAVKLCALFLRMENVLALTQLDGPGGDNEEADEAQKELELLLRCANLVCSEIASDYFPLKKEQWFCSQDGYINFLEFESLPIDIFCVKADGYTQAFKQFPSEIKTVPGKVKITYSYLPQNKQLGDELDFNKGKIHARTIAYGTAAEYCLISGLYEEALIWDKRYKDSLISAVKTVRVVNMPKRRWA